MVELQELNGPHGRPDPMDASDLMGADAIEAARLEVASIVRSAGLRRHELLAAIAVRLAPLGHVLEVRASFAQTADAAEALKACALKLEAEFAQTAIAPPAEAEPAQAAQEAAGAEQDADEAGTEKGASVICRAPSVIPLGIVAEIRDALAPEPLSFRALRTRIGRGWSPTRLALQSLIDAGEVAREGDRGRGVRFALLSTPGPASAAASFKLQGVHV